MLEKTIETYLVKATNILGGLAIKIPSVYQRGLPDRMILLPKRKIGFIELKRKGGKPTAIQIARHKQFKALGFPVTVCDTTQSIDDALTQLSKRSHKMDFKQTA